jgi:hypothetical protein
MKCGRLLVFYDIALLCNAFDPTIHKVRSSVQPPEQERIDSRYQAFYTAQFCVSSPVPPPPPQPTRKKRVGRHR